MGPHQFETAIHTAKRDAALYSAGVTWFEDTAETMDAAFDDWRGCRSRALPLIAAILADEYREFTEDCEALGLPLAGIRLADFAGKIFREALPLAEAYLPEDDGFPAESPFDDPSIGFRKFE